MKLKSLFNILFILASCWILSAIAFPCFKTTGLPPYEIANTLGWVPTGTNVCGGYYQEPAIVLTCVTPPDLDAAPTTITAERTVSYSATGTSTLEGNVVITQPGRKMTAQKAILYRDPQTNEISQIFLQGNIHYYESGKHLVAQCVFVDLQKKYVKLDNVLYRLVKPTRRETLNAWGQASSAIRRSNSDIVLNNATYTTCPPIKPTWKIIANKLHINRDRGWGEAFNTYLLVHNTPLVWIPYFSFPVDKQRKGGFLFPTAGYSNNNGFHINFPYYLNLAPNYDATISPNYIYRRGLQFEGHFRYLTCHSTGNLDVEFLPYDNVFAHFRRTAAEVYGISPSTIPFLDRINNESNSRGYLSFRDNTHLNEHWWGSININYVTDDYYLQDFAYNPFFSSTDQLLNQAEINYASDNWRFIGRLQTWQTLHPINQQPILNQYSRLPQLFFRSDYPELPNKLAFQINGGYDYFEIPNNIVTGLSSATGQRAHLQPSLSIPFITPYSFITPRLLLDGTLYDLHDWEPTHVSRLLPIFSVDSGLFFERQYECYTQTLEPRIFYLYVPTQNQNDIPIFDTTLPSFGFAQLFRFNRFVGYDRLGDANQVSFALTTRFLNSCTGLQRLRASIGQIIYLVPPKVSLTPDKRNDFYVNETLSPIVGELNYNFNTAWTGVADAAVNPYDHGLNNASLRFHYRPDCKHIFNIGYDFVRKGDTLTTYALNSSKDNLNRVSLALAWQLNDHWQALGSWNYNLSHGHNQAYLYGFQYDSCCWAVRFVASRILTAENMNDLSTYQNNVYVQLQLKGLGNIGISDPGGLLTSSIFGYEDNFRG